MTNASLIALHGFLGLPTDWDCFSQIQAMNVEAQDRGLWEWAEGFNARAPKGRPRILMGYSLGGRLALHALLASQTLWDAAVIISAHPGLASHVDREARLQKSLAWADRFEKDPWNVLMRDWEAQAVFTHTSHRFSRKETDYDRSQLADMLRYWSLGHQDHLAPRLAALPIPLLWIAGDNDPSYREIASTIRLSHPQSRVWIAPGAGHRVPWEQPAAFQQQLRHFLLEK